MQYSTLRKNTLIAWFLDRIIIFIGFLAISLTLVFFFSLGIFFKLLFAAVNLLLFYYASISIFFEKRMLRFHISASKIVILFGFIYTKQTYIPISSIRDLVYTQTPIQRWLKVGKLHLYTAGSKHVINGIDKSYYEQIHNYLR